MLTPEDRAVTSSQGVVIHAFLDLHLREHPARGDRCDGQTSALGHPRAAHLAWNAVDLRALRPSSTGICLHCALRGPAWRNAPNGLRTGCRDMPRPAAFCTRVNQNRSNHWRIRRSDAALNLRVEGSIPSRLT